MELQLPAKTYNLRKLDADLRASLQTKVIGVSRYLSHCAAILAENATAEDQAQALAIAAAHDAAQLSPDQQTFANVKSIAQSAEGIVLTDLTAAQVKSLLAVLLWRAGGVTNDGKVRPLAEWAG